MNLKQGNGYVPIRNFNTASNAPYLLVEFPNPVIFKSLYRASITAETLEKYHAILQKRMAGATLDEAGKPYGLTRERIRQIEAKFIRSLEKRYAHLPTPFSMTETP